MKCRGLIIFLINGQKLDMGFQVKFDIQHNIDWILLEKKLIENVSYAISLNMKTFQMQSQYGPIYGCSFGQGTNSLRIVFLISISSSKDYEYSQNTLLCQIYAEVIENSIKYEFDPIKLDLSLTQKYAIVRLVNENQIVPHIEHQNFMSVSEKDSNRSQSII